VRFLKSASGVNLLVLWLGRLVMSADASRNWRESLTPQQRASVQKHIFTRLAALVEGVSEKDLWARSVTFEEREFARASSQQEYLHRIAVGLQNAERAVGGHAEAPQGAPASRPAKQQPAQASSDTLLMAPLPRRLNEWQEHPVDATEVQLDEQRKRARSACSNSSAPTVRETRPPRTQSMTSIPFGMEARVQSVQSAPPADNERSPCSFSVSSSVDGARAAQIAQVSRTDGMATGAAPIGGRISGSTTNFKRANTPLAPNLFNPQQKEVIRTVLDAYQEMPEELRAHGFGALPPHVIERLAQVFPNDPIVFAAFAAAMAVGTAQREVLYVRFIAALNAAREAAARYAISKSLSMAAASVSAQMSSPNLRRSISVGAPETLFAASPNLTRPLSGHAMENEVHESPTRIFAELADFQAREGQVFRGALGIIRTALQKQTDPFLRERHMENIQAVLNLIQMNPSTLTSTRYPTLAEIQRARSYVQRWVALLQDVAGRSRSTSSTLRRTERRAQGTAPTFQTAVPGRTATEVSTAGFCGNAAAPPAPSDASTNARVFLSTERDGHLHVGGQSPASLLVGDAVDSNKPHALRSATPADVRRAPHSEPNRAGAALVMSSDSSLNAGLMQSLGYGAPSGNAATRREGGVLPTSGVTATGGDSELLKTNFEAVTVSSNQSPAQTPTIMPKIVTLLGEHGNVVAVKTESKPSMDTVPGAERKTASCFVAEREPDGKQTDAKTFLPGLLEMNAADTKPPRDRFMDTVRREMALAMEKCLPPEYPLKLEHILDWELGGPIIRISTTVIPEGASDEHADATVVHFPILLFAFPSPHYLERNCRGVAITFRSAITLVEEDSWAYLSASAFLRSIRAYCHPEEAAKIDRSLGSRALHLRVLLLYVNISVFEMVQLWIQSVCAFAPIQEGIALEQCVQTGECPTSVSEVESRAAKSSQELSSAVAALDVSQSPTTSSANPGALNGSQQASSAEQVRELQRSSLDAASELH